METLEEITKKTKVPWWKRTLATSALIATMAISAACGVVDSGKSNECSYDSDCNSNFSLQCDDELCHYTEDSGKLSGKLYCEFDSDCPPTINCDDNVCGDSGDSPGFPKITTTNYGDFFVHHAKTNNDGAVSFVDQQTGIEFVLYTVDSTNEKPISGSEVTFTDANQFNAFLIEKGNYNVVFEAFPGDLNQGKSDAIEILEFMFGLNPAQQTTFTIWDKYVEENPSKINSMEGYIDWAESGKYDYIRCLTRDQMAKSRDYTAEIISSVSGWQVISTAYEKILKLDEWGLINSLPNEVYHEYGPRDFTAPPLMLGSDLVKEICGDGMDGDCDGKVDSKDSDCEGIMPTCQNECYNEGQQSCEGSKKVLSCEEGNDGCLDNVVIKYCSDDEQCKSGDCKPKEPTCESNCDYIGQKGCTSTGSHETECKDKYDNGCLKKYTEDYCGNELTCIDGHCQPDQPVCEDACSTEGQLSCNGNSVISCEKKNDDCLYKLVIESCSESNSECINGACQSVDVQWFQDLGDGTVLDEQTGDVWLKSSPGTMSYWSANTYCNDLSMAGSTSWRLPTREELTTLRVDTVQSNGLYLSPAFNPIDEAWTTENCGAGMENYRHIIDFTDPNDYTFDKTCLDQDSPSHPKCIKD
jgi:hypothetical protein